MSRRLAHSIFCNPTPDLSPRPGSTDSDSKSGSGGGRARGGGGAGVGRSGHGSRLEYTGFAKGSGDSNNNNINPAGGINSGGTTTPSPRLDPKGVGGQSKGAKKAPPGGPAPAAAQPFKGGLAALSRVRANRKAAPTVTAATATAVTGAGPGHGLVDTSTPLPGDIRADSATMTGQVRPSAAPPALAGAGIARDRLECCTWYYFCTVAYRDTLGNE